MSYWSVVITKPQYEATAMTNLKSQGFLCYAPRFLETKVRGGRKIDFLHYLFPRYVFVFVEGAWRSILGTIGVSSVLLDGEAPGKVPNKWVDGMKDRENSRGLVELPKERFRRGQLVRVNYGKWSGFSGLYDGMNAKRREMVLIEMFGRWTRVELAAEDLR